jgi:hypothetical protein
MRLRTDQIEKLSLGILKHLKGKKLIQIKAGEEIVLKKIKDVITQNLEEEDELEAQAKNLLDQYRQQIQSGSLNERDLYLKIKKELARKKKFVL